MKSGRVNIYDWRGLYSGAAAARLWFGPFSVTAAWLGLALGLILSPDRFGASLCWVQDVTGLPCLGCGLTRSLSCGLRGMFEPSWHYHPMGILILALFLIIAGQSLLPRHHRQRLHDFVTAYAFGFQIAYFAFVFLFVAYGVGRAALHCFGW